MTRDEIKLACLRTQAIAREDYGYHLFLQRWWVRDGYGYASNPVVHWECEDEMATDRDGAYRWARNFGMDALIRGPDCRMGG